jgi:hypothetical protein
MASEDAKSVIISISDLSRHDTLVDSEPCFEPDKLDGTPARTPYWRRIRHRLSGLCINWWLTEILSWCLGALCIIAIAVLLFVWKGRELPSSFPLGLKLNAYISVLSAVAKLALAVPLEEALATQKYLWFTTGTPKRPLVDFERFELAARRPVGALKLIWRLKAKLVEANPLLNILQYADSIEGQSPRLELSSFSCLWLWIRSFSSSYSIRAVPACKIEVEFHVWSPSMIRTL